MRCCKKRSLKRNNNCLKFYDDPEPCFMLRLRVLYLPVLVFSTVRLELSAGITAVQIIDRKIKIIYTKIVSRLTIVVEVLLNE